LYEGGRERARRRKMAKEGNKVIPDLVDSCGFLKVTHERVKTKLLTWC
jgi:hypothetical protein